MKFRIFIVSVLALSCLLTACKKDKPVPPVKSGSGQTPLTGSVEFVFEPYVDDKPLLDSTNYANVHGDTFTVSKFNYYVSNIQLTRTDGSVHQAKEYHLIRHFHGKNTFRVSGIMPGNYNKLQFLLGVDSLRNVSGAQTGDLDPVHNMFWDWSSGYIYFKMEGKFKTLQQSEKDDYTIHIGGFKQPYPCLQTVSMILDTAISVKSDRVPTLVLKSDAAEVFTGPHAMGFEYYYRNITEHTFQKVSENYIDMFTVKKVQN